eukprot:g9136.t1
MLRAVFLSLLALLFADARELNKKKKTPHKQPLLSRGLRKRSDSETDPGPVKGSSFLKRKKKCGPKGEDTGDKANPTAVATPAAGAAAVEATAQAAPASPAGTAAGGKKEPPKSSTSTTTATPFEFPSIDGGENFPKPVPANTLLGSVVTYESNAGNAGCGCNTNWYLDCGTTGATLQCDSGGAGPQGKELDFI